MSSQWKQAARESLAGNWLKMIGLFIIAMLLNGAVQVVYQVNDPSEVDAVTGVLALVSSVLSILLIPLLIGWYWLGLDVARGKEPTVGRLFKPFTERYGRHVLTGFLVNLFIGLWTLLFIVPGLIKWFSYSLTYYILKDRPELSALEAISESRRMMDGHKWRAFTLTLSFIGWILLGMLTLGLALLYVMPYYVVTYSHFYESVRDDYYERNRPQFEKVDDDAEEGDELAFDASDVD